MFSKPFREDSLRHERSLCRLYRPWICEELLDETVDLCTIIWSLPLREELIGALRRRRFFRPAVSDAITAFADLCEICVPATASKTHLSRSG
jgi:hypothetical protein